MQVIYKDFEKVCLDIEEGALFRGFVSCKKMLKLLNVLEILGQLLSFWECLGLFLVCFGLCCGVLWRECVDSCGVLWDCRSIMKIAKIIKSVMAITELKKIAKKRDTSQKQAFEAFGIV